MIGGTGGLAQAWIPCTWGSGVGVWVQSEGIALKGSRKALGYFWEFPKTHPPPPPPGSPSLPPVDLSTLTYFLNSVFCP